MLKLIMLLRVNTTDRLKKLREEMIMSNLDAYIVPLGNILMTGDRMYSYFFQFIRSFSELSFIFHQFCSFSNLNRSLREMVY